VASVVSVRRQGMLKVTKLKPGADLGFTQTSLITMYEQPLQLNSLPKLGQVLGAVYVTYL
jgi:hypothetical protein